MKKEEFLEELENLLLGISEEERADAIAFYRSYFEDAGEENESSILEELGSPQKVADSILKDLGVDTQTAGTGNAQGGADTGNTGYYNAAQQQVPPQKDNAGMTVLFIVLAVLASPIWLSLLVVAASIVFAIIVTVFALAVSAVAVMAALLIGGVVLTISGIMLIPGGNLAAGIGLIGGGCLIVALGLLALLLCVLVCGVFLPWAVKSLLRQCKKLLDKRKGR